MSIEDEARAFATKAHGSIDQRRKYTFEPYIVHPIAGAEIVRGVPHDDGMIAAALLHDVVEDTPVTLQELDTLFGPDVAALVDQLTAPSKPSDGDCATRVAINPEHSGRSSSRAQTIKVADVIDNCRSIMLRDRDFATIYLSEKRRLLEVLTRADKHLVGIAWGILTQE